MKSLQLLPLALISGLLLDSVPAAAVGRTERHVIPTDLVDRARTANIYLPDGYDETDQHYPVIYVLHGSGGGPNNFHSPNDWNRMIEQEEMQPVIFVLPDRNSFGRGPRPVNDPYDQHIAEEVVAYVDRNFRTIPRREARALVGYSLGGVDAWQVSMRYPELFRLVGTWAMGRIDRQLIANPLQTHLQHRYPLEFWMYRGRRDTNVGSIRPLIDVLEGLHFPHTFIEDGGNHISHINKNAFTNMAYFSHRLWEESNASAPYPLRQVTQTFSTPVGAATTMNLVAVLQVQDEMPALTLNGTSAGLDSALPLDYQGEGRYTALLSFTAPTAQGVYYLPLHRHSTTDGSAALFPVRLRVLPAQEQQLWADGEERAWDINRLTTLDAQASTEVFEGGVSLAVEAKTGFRFAWALDAPLASFGYTLQFALHPGTPQGNVLVLDLETGDELEASIKLDAPGLVANTFSGGVQSFAELTLNGEPAQGVDLTQAGWQIVEIPLDQALFGKPGLHALGFSGGIEGTFYLDDIRLVPQPLSSPLPQIFLPALRFAGGTEVITGVVGQLAESVTIDFAVEPRVEDDLPELRLDGSSVGAPAALRLSPNGNNRHRAQLPIDPNLGDGLYRLPVFWQKENGNSELFAALRLLVFPAEDRILYHDDTLSAEWERGRSFLVDVDPEANDPVFSGSTSIALQPKSSNTSALLTWRPSTAAFGYTLRFAFRPGALESLDRPSVLDVLVEDAGGQTQWALLNPEAPRLDLQQPIWQTIELPLGDQPVESIAFIGNLKGTFYLDDIRLVPQEAPVSETAVLETRQDNEPAAFQLNQNYPNPFNSGTVIPFALPQDQDVDLAIYNLVGQKVVQLVQGFRTAGQYSVHWDGRDAAGRSLATGLYFYHLQAGSKIETRKLVMVR